MSDLAAVLVCACEDTGDDQCIGGNVFSYCTSELCGGACSYDGKCPCPLHDLIDHDTLYVEGDSRPYRSDQVRAYDAG